MYIALFTFNILQTGQFLCISKNKEYFAKNEYKMPFLFTLNF